MANDEKSWVEERLAVLSPPEDWHPDPETALTGYRGKDYRARPGWQIWTLRTAAVSLPALALFALPQTRALAQRAWQFFQARQVEIIRVSDLDVDSLRARVLVKPKQEIVRDRNEASRRAGFRVQLPRSGVGDGAPSLSILTPSTYELVVSNADLDKSLQSAGIADMHPPKDWDGVHIGAHFNSVVMAGYPDIMLMQTTPVVISAPPGFQFAAFTEMALRILGLDPSQARQLAGRMAANPAWFLDIPREDKVTIRDVSLHSGQGTLVHDFDDKGEFERLTLIWNTPDRIYILSAKISDDLAIAVANSLD